jgi:hypothetical protein
MVYLSFDYLVLVLVVSQDFVGTYNSVTVLRSSNILVPIYYLATMTWCKSALVFQ